MESQLMKIHLARILALPACCSASAARVAVPAADPATATRPASARDQGDKKIGAVYLDEGYMVIEDQIFRFQFDAAPKGFKRHWRDRQPQGSACKGMYVNIRLPRHRLRPSRYSDVRIVR